MNEQMKAWAHEYALEMAKQGMTLRSCVQLGWKYAEAMQAQAEERRAPEPDLCNHEWQPVYELNVKYHEVCSLCGAIRVDW